MHLENISFHTLTVSAALVAIEALTMPAVAANVSAGTSNTMQSTKPTAEATLLAQAESCRQVSAPVGGMRVYAEPNVYSESVGVVEDGRNVTIQNLGANGWVPIIAPVEGYIAAEYLTGCNLSLTNQEPALRVANETDLCRMVVARRGLNVRSEPSLYANRIDGLLNGAMVTIEGPGAEGWVELAEPLDGYVSANYLAACP